MAHVLIIDDERPVIRAIARLLLFGGHEIEVAETAEAAEKRLTSGAFDIASCLRHVTTAPRSPDFSE